MGFFKNVNAEPRIGSVIIQPDGFSIYTENGWQKFTKKDISDIIDNARIVERVDGSHTDIDDIFGEHISSERVFYELVLRSVCSLLFSQFAFFGNNNQIFTCTVTISTERLILDQQETYIRGWFSSHDIIRDIFEKYPDNIEFYMRQAIKYLQKLKSEGVSYKYIDESYMQQSVYTPYSVIYSVIKGNRKGYF